MNKLFTNRNAFRCNPNLDYPRFVESRYAHVLEGAIIYFAPAYLLDHNLLLTGK